MNGSVRFSNAHPLSSSPLDRRSSARRVASRTDVDFDEIPSPRQGKSLVSGARRSSVGSPLHSYAPPDFDDDPFDAGEDAEMDAEMEDSGLLSTPKQQSTSRRANTSNAVHSESDDDVPRAQSKGKARMETQEEDDVVEEEISRGLGDVEMQEDEDEEVAEPPSRKPPKEKKPRKKRVLPETPCKSTPTAMRNTHTTLLPAVSPENTTGIRRGKRLRYEPLEWWRCEKVVYGRRDPGKLTYVPTIKEIVRIPKDPPKPLGAAHKRRRNATPRIKSEDVVIVDDPEEGWDDKTPTNGVVIDWFTGNEVSRRAFSISTHSQRFFLTCIPQVWPTQGA